MARRKMRKFSVKATQPMNSEINVTPLVDVVLVLLIIFMVVTPLLEKDIQVAVPSMEKVEAVAEIPPDQLVVRVEANGDLKLNDDVVSIEEYTKRLTERLSPKPKADKIVFFVADDRANYARLVQALDGAKKAGASTLGMATEDAANKQQ